METNETDEEIIASTQKNPSGSKIKKLKKPPPLVIHPAVDSRSKFVKILKDILIENFYIKYHKDFTEVFISSQIEYEKLKNIWLQNNYQFY